MKYLVFDVFDSVAGIYLGQLVLARTLGEAVRTFDYSMKQLPMIAPSSALYKIGEYDSETGEFVPCHEFIKNAEVQ